MRRWSYTMINFELLPIHRSQFDERNWHHFMASVKLQFLHMHYLGYYYYIILHPQRPENQIKQVLELELRCPSQPFLNMLNAPRKLAMLLRSRRREKNLIKLLLKFRQLKSDFVLGLRRYSCWYIFLLYLLPSLVSYDVYGIKIKDEVDLLLIYSSFTTILHKLNGRLGENHRRRRRARRPVWGFCVRRWGIKCVKVTVG